MWLLEQLRQGQEQEWSFLMCVDGLFLYFFWTYEGKKMFEKEMQRKQLHNATTRHE
jgi:hypothetical protein